MRRFFFSLRFRLVLIVLIPILPLVGVGGFVILKTRQDAIKNVQEELYDMVRPAAHKQEYLILEARQLLLIISKMDEIVTLDQPECNETLAELMNQSQRYANIGVIGLDGYVVCSALPFQEPVYAGDRSYFIQALEREDFSVGEYQIGRITVIPGINFGYPVRDDDRNVIAVAFVALDLTWLTDLIGEMEFPKEAEVTIFDRNAIVLVRYPDPGEWIGKKVPEASIFEEIVGEYKDGTFDAEGLDGVKRLYTFALLHNSDQNIDIYIALGIAKKIAYEEANRYLVIILSLLGIATVVGVGTAWLMGEISITRRVHALMYATKRLTAGDLKARSNIPKGMSEFRQLGIAFDDMAESLEHTTRAFRTLSRCNQNLIRATSEDELLSETCRIIVEEGQYKMAWIGYAENNEEKTVLPVAKWGFEEGYLESIKITWKDDEYGRGPTGTAIRTGEVCINPSTELEEHYEPWRKQALERGYGSSIALPLKNHSRVLGALNIYAEVQDAFDSKEVELLKELADDLGYGLGALRAKQGLKRAVQALRDREAKTRLIIEENADGILVLDQQTRVLFANPAAERIFLRPEETFLGREFGYPITIGQVTEIEVVRSEGGIATVEMRAVPFEWERAAAILVSLRDISQRVVMKKRLQRLLEQQIAINQLAIALGEFQDIEKIYEIIYQHVNKLMDAQAFIISFFDPDEQLIRAGYVMSGGNVQDVANFPPIPLEKEGRGTQSQVIRTGEAFYVPDYRKAMQRTETEYKIAENGTVSEGAPPPEAQKDSTNSALFAPMKIKGKTIGVLQIQSHQLDAYGQDDSDLLCALANVAAIAINNARLFADVEQQTQNLSTILESVATVSSSLDLETVLDKLARYMTQAVQVDGCTISLWDQNTQAIVTCIEWRGDKFPPEPAGTVYYLDDFPATRTVLETRQPLSIRLSDPQADAAELAHMKKVGTQSMLMLPIVLGEEVIGLVELDVSDYEKAFTSQEIELCQGIASQAAQAIVNARRYQQIKQQASEFETLYQIAGELSRQHELQALLEQIVTSAMNLLDTPGGMLYLLDAKSNQLEVMVSQGSFIPPGERIQPGEGVSDQILQTHQPLVVEDYQTWEHRITRFNNLDVGAVLAVPLLYTGELIGVLVLHTRRGQKRGFSNADQHTLELLAGQAASAVANMRALAEAHRRLKHIQALRDIDTAMIGSTDLRLTLRIILEHTTAQLGVDAACVLLLNAETHTLEFAAGRGFRTSALEHTHLRLGEGYAGRAALERQFIYIANLMEHHTDFLRSPMFFSEGFVAYYAVPLISKSQIKGVLDIFHRSPLDSEQEWYETFVMSEINSSLEQKLQMYYLD
ncbi:MAG: GAF domain-containing protein [Chloroflexota bacterium]